MEDRGFKIDRDWKTERGVESEEEIGIMEMRTHNILQDFLHGIGGIMRDSRRRGGNFSSPVHGTDGLVSTSVLPG